jgi:hypothetical protein
MDIKGKWFSIILHLHHLLFELYHPLVMTLNLPDAPYPGKNQTPIDKQPSVDTYLSSRPNNLLFSLSFQQADLQVINHRQFSLLHAGPSPKRLIKSLGIRE